MIAASMDNHVWQPDHGKVFGTLLDHATGNPEYWFSTNVVFRPTKMASVRGNPPTRRFFLTHSSTHVLNEGPYARSPAYAARILLSTDPDPTQLGPTAMEIYTGSLPYRIGTESYEDGDFVGMDAGLTSIGACMEFLYYDGWIDKYVWANSLDDMLKWLILGDGPVLIDLPVYKDFTFDDGGLMQVDGPILGREVFILNGANTKANEVRLMSVHGYDWGYKGMKRMPMEDFQLMLAMDTHLRACAVIGKHVGIQASLKRDDRRVAMNQKLMHYAATHEATMKLRQLASQDNDTEQTIATPLWSATGVKQQ